MWVLGRLNFLTLLGNITTRLFLPTDWPALRVWFAAMAVTYTSSGHRVCPLSSSYCKKVRMDVMSHEEVSSFPTAHQSENTDHLRHLVDRALTSEMVLATLTDSCKDSHQGAKCEGNTILVGDAKLFLLFGKRGLSMESGTELLTAAVSTWGTMAGSIRVGLLRGPSIWLPWLVWWPEGAEQLEGRRTGRRWANRGPGCLALLRKMLGSESCLLRQRGWPLPSRRSPRSEPFRGGASVFLETHCHGKASLPGSVCLACELPPASTSCIDNCSHESDSLAGGQGALG